MSADDRRSPQEIALARLKRKLERENRAAERAAEGAPPSAQVERAADGTLAVRGTPQPRARADAAAGADASPAHADAPGRRAPPRGSAEVKVERASRLAAKIDAYERLIRLDKPIGWLLLLWPTLTALWIACWGSPSVSTLVILIAGTILMRSAGCAFNDWADRDFDRHVKRTANRPLATGEVSPREALILGAALALCAFGLVLFTNRLTILLSVPALALALAYPFMKRVIALPQAFLGIAFSFGIPMAFAAQTGEVPALAWWLLLINLFWVMAYDTEYAMVDRDDDERIGMRTSAIAFGRHDVLAVGVSYAINLLGMAWIGWQRRLTWPYYVGLAVAAAIAAYHVALIRTRDRDACFRAFRHNHWYGLAVFAGTALALWARYRAWPTLD
jgi:4-hydroxybenzoate polyprenyltransferase